MTTVGRWSPNKVRARVLDGTWVSPTEELGGMVLLTPTSIAYSGTSASIGANGSVEFSGVNDLELRGVFVGDYDNYMVTFSTRSGASCAVNAQFLSGTTPIAGSNYVRQYLFVDSTSVLAGRGAATTSFRIHQDEGTQSVGTVVYFYGPYLAQPTAIRTNEVLDGSNAILLDSATTHSLSASYDGLKLITAVAITGLVSVYGLVGA